MHHVQVAGARIGALMHICTESTVTYEAVSRQSRSHTKLVLSTHAFSKSWHKQRYANEVRCIVLTSRGKNFEIGAVRRQCEMTVTDFI